MEQSDRKPLTGKMKKWADAYLETLNKTEAARRAGYGGNDADLANIGYQNYRKLEIQAYLKDQLDKMAMSAEEAIARLGDMASSSHADFAEVNLREDLKGHPKAHLVKTVITDVYEDKMGKVHHKLRLELYDAQSAILNVLKIHGKFNNDAGSSEDKPFIVKVVYGERANSQSPQSSPETD